MTQRRIPGCIRLILRVLLDQCLTLRAGLGPSLCVEIWRENIDLAEKYNLPLSYQVH